LDFFIFLDGGAYVPIEILPGISAFQIGVFTLNWGCFQVWGIISIFSLKMAFFQNGVFIKRAKNGLPARRFRCAGMDFSLFLAFGNFARHNPNIE
jgi:hypothetical protein